MNSKHIFFSETHGVQKPISCQILLFHIIPIQIPLSLFLPSHIFLFNVFFQYSSFFCLLIFKPRSLQGTSWSFSGCHDATNFVCGRFLGKKLLQKPNSRFIHSFIQLISYSNEYASLTIFNFTHANNWWALGIFQSNVESGLKFTTCRELYNVTIIG